MNPKDQDRLLIVTITLLALAALTYGAIVMVAWLSGRGVNFKEVDGAAWTQAVGSVGAIFVAIWVFHRQTAQAEQHARTREAAGVRLRASLLRTLADIAREVEDISFVQAVDSETGQRNMTPELSAQFAGNMVQLQLALQGLGEFRTPELTSGTEAQIWVQSRRAAEAVYQLCLTSNAGDTLHRERLQRGIRSVATGADFVDRIADYVQLGQWQRVEALKPRPID